jgi:hypothetical protein
MLLYIQEKHLYWMLIDVHGWKILMRALIKEKATDFGRSNASFSFFIQTYLPCIRHSFPWQLAKPRAWVDRVVEIPADATGSKNKS